MIWCCTQQIPHPFPCCDTKTVRTRCQPDKQLLCVVFDSVAIGPCSVPTNGENLFKFFILFVYVCCAPPPSEESYIHLYKDKLREYGLPVVFKSYNVKEIGKLFEAFVRCTDIRFLPDAQWIFDGLIGYHLATRSTDGRLTLKPTDAVEFIRLVDGAHAGMRTCAFCYKFGHAQQCARCRQACYCNRICQRAHWSTHKKACKLEAQ